MRYLTDLVVKGCLQKLEGDGRNTRYALQLPELRWCWRKPTPPLSVLVQPGLWLNELNAEDQEFDLGQPSLQCRGRLRKRKIKHAKA